MIKAKIIVADSKQKNRQYLRDILIKHGYSVVAEVSNAPELLRKTRNLFPDLVIVDSDIEGGSIYEVASIIEYDCLSSVLVLSGSIKACSVDSFPHVVKPFNEETLVSVVEVCLLYAEKFNAAKKEVHKLQESLRNRKIIEQAKGMLINTMKMSEEEAYRNMQKLSMDKSMPMVDIAKAIINSKKNGKEE